MKHLTILLILIGLNLSSFSQTVPMLKIGLIADPQYENIEPSGPRNFKESLWKLEEAIDTFNYYQVDFIQNIGDIINHDYVSFDSIMPIYDNINPNIENYHLLGNHDFNIESSHLEELLDLFSMPNYYYSYVKNNWRFIVLDATDYSYFANPLHNYDIDLINSYYNDTEGQENHHRWNGSIGEIQQDWLLNQLDSSELLKQKTIIFSHIPIKPLYTADNLWNDSEIIDIIENSSNVVAYISGHHHEGNFVLESGINYITLFGMVNTMLSSYSILEIYKDRMVLKGCGNQESYLLLLDNIQVTENSSDFKIYPNPTKNNIHISVSKKVDLCIYSIIGKKILEKKDLINENIIVSNFEKGIYIITLMNKKGFVTKKLIVE